MEQSQREAEAITEGEILELKTRGAQKTIDEAKLRQSLASSKLADMQADRARLEAQDKILAGLEEQARLERENLTSTGAQRLIDEKTIEDKLAEAREKAVQTSGVLFTKEEQTNAILQARNTLLEQQRTINESILAQQDEQLSQEEKKLSRLTGLVSKLPHFMQKKYVEKELQMSDQDATDLQKRADRARGAGDTTTADQYQNRADEARDQSAEIRDMLKVWNDQPPVPTVDALQQLGEGGRIAVRSPQSAMAGTENKLQQIIDILKKNPGSARPATHPGRMDLPSSNPGFDIA